MVLEGMDAGPTPHQRAHQPCHHHHHQQGLLQPWQEKVLDALDLAPKINGTPYWPPVRGFKASTRPVSVWTDRTPTDPSPWASINQSIHPSIHHR